MNVFLSIFFNEVQDLSQIASFLDLQAPPLDQGTTFHSEVEGAVFKDVGA